MVREESSRHEGSRIISPIVISNCELGTLGFELIRAMGLLLRVDGGGMDGWNGETEASELLL